MTEATGHLSRSFSFDTPGDERSIPYVWIRMANAGATENLVSGNLPVDFHWGPNAIQNIAAVPAPPAVLDNNEHVDVTFDYIAGEAGGVRLFLVPLTAGAPSPHAATSGSVVYPAGSGSTANRSSSATRCLWALMASRSITTCPRPSSPAKTESLEPFSAKNRTQR